MDILSMIIPLASGAIGGNLAGGLFKNLSLGTLGNSIAGIAGGGIGGSILGMIGLGGAAGGGMDIGSIIAGLGSGAVGGGVVMAVVGAVRNMIGR